LNESSISFIEHNGMLWNTMEHNISL